VTPKKQVENDGQGRYALPVNYPERFAQEALGHNSKAVHRAYARKAKVIVPALETNENTPSSEKLVPLLATSAQA